MDVPTVEVVDLPGIQMLPTNSYETSVSLVKSFVNKHDTLTIVLCVIPATNASIDGGPGLDLVQKFCKPECTIVALTKADKVDLQDPDEIRDQLFRPLLRDLDCLSGIGGCVAVSNRKHNDSVGLADMRMREAAMFERALATASGEFATDAIKQRLRANMGSKQLIVQLAAMYRRHVVDSWVPRVQADADRQHTTAQDQLNQLGLPLQDVQRDIGQTLASIQSKVLHYFEAVFVISALCTHINRGSQSTSVCVHGFQACSN